MLNKLNENSGTQDENQNLKRSPALHKTASAPHMPQRSNSVLPPSSSTPIMKQPHTSIDKHKSRLSFQFVDNMPGVQKPPVYFGNQMEKIEERASERTMQVNKLEKSKDKEASPEPTDRIEMKSKTKTLEQNQPELKVNTAELEGKLDRLHSMIEKKVTEIEKNVKKMKTDNRKEFKEINLKLNELFDVNF